MRSIRTMIEIDAPPAVVWAQLVDLPAHASWNPFFASLAGDVKVGATLAVRARKADGTPGMGFKPTILEVEPERLLRWRGRVVMPGLFDGEHVYALTPLADGTRTRLDHSETFSGILVPLMGRVLAETEDGFGRFNEALAARSAAATEQV